MATIPTLLGGTGTPGGGGNIQVGANTSQAVGAFNNLVQSINATNAALQQMQQNAAASGTAFTRHYDPVLRLDTAWNKLVGTGRFVIDMFQATAHIGEGVFSSLLKELDKIQGFNSIMKVTTGSTEEAAKSYDFLRQTADKLGQPFDSLIKDYGKLLAAIPKGNDQMQKAQRIFLGVAEAARSMHASNQDTQLMFYAVTQIASKGVVSMEELRRQLGEKLPGVLQIAAQALNTTPALLEAAVRKGIVNSDKFLNYFSDALIRTFKESSEQASKAVSASLNRMTNLWTDFTKSVLDSGAADAIGGLFDVIRDKLNDPYIIGSFAKFVKDTAERLTEFVKNLTAEDIRNGFDTFTKGIEAMVKLLGLLIDGLTWVINHSKTAGTAIGAIGGAMLGATAGMAFGPPGMAIGAGVGAVVGGVGGFFAGRAVAPSDTDYAARAALDDKVLQGQKDNNARQSAVVLSMLNLINKVGIGPRDVSQLFTPERANNQTLELLNSIFSDNRFKTDAQRRVAIGNLAYYGQPLGSTGTLNDVIGGPGKPSPDEKRREGTFWQSFGFDRNFKQSWDDLTALFQGGRFGKGDEGRDVLAQAQSQLLKRQPFMEQLAKQQGRYNTESEKQLGMLIKEIEYEDKVKTLKERQLDVARMLPEEADIQAKVNEEAARFEGKHLEFTQQKRKEAEEYYRVLADTLRVQQAEARLLSEGPDRNRAFVDALKADQALKANPASGYTNQDSRILFAQNDRELFSTTNVGLEAVKRQYDDMYAKIDAYQRRQIITEGEAADMRIASTERYKQAVLAVQTQIAQSRLDGGIGTMVDGVNAALGRLIQGFTTFTGGAAQVFGNFFDTLNNGFAEAFGRAIVYGENLGDALKKVAQEAFAQLIAALIKLGIQWVIQQTLLSTVGETAMAAQTAASTAAAGATATAWAPAAAMVSLASFGANAAPAITGIVATTSISSALATLSGLGKFEQGGYVEPIKGFEKGGYVDLAHVRGFETGGYVDPVDKTNGPPGFETGGFVAPELGAEYAMGGFTGFGGRKQVAGVVHGQEFVVNARQTAKHRDLLEMINKGVNGYETGGYVTTGYDSGGYVSQPTVQVQAAQPIVLNGSVTKVIVNNNVANTQVRREERQGPEGPEIEITIEETVAKSILRGGRVADALERQYQLNRSNSLTY